jgi:hypothetical protein
MSRRGTGHRAEAHSLDVAAFAEVYVQRDEAATTLPLAHRARHDPQDPVVGWISPLAAGQIGGISGISATGLVRRWDQSVGSPEHQVLRPVGGNADAQYAPKDDERSRQRLR